MATAKKKTTAPKNYVLIAGRKVYIQYIIGLKDLVEDWGQFEENSEGHFVIKIDASLEGAALRSTLAHEAIHAVFHLTGASHILEETHKGLEESLVRSLEYIYLPTLRELSNYIDERSDDK